MQFKIKMQRGGVRFSDIITVENRDRFIGQEIEIVSIIEKNDTDLLDTEFINQLKTERGFIEQADPSDLIYFNNHGYGILAVNYALPKYGGNPIILNIPQNLQDLAQDLGSDNPRFTYYVRLRQQRGPDLFTRDELIQTKNENIELNTFNHVSHGYIPPTSNEERVSDLEGNIPELNRYLGRDVFDLISVPYKNSILNNRYLRRSRYPGSRYTQ